MPAVETGCAADGLLFLLGGYRSCMPPLRRPPSGILLRSPSTLPRLRLSALVPAGGRLRSRTVPIAAHPYARVVTTQVVP